MKAIIMAGGPSSRLRPLTKYIPKCMLKVNIHEDTTIIDTQIIMLNHFGIKDIVVVTGFAADKLKNHLSKYKGVVNIKFVNNKKYLETYPAYAFWLTKKYLNDTFIYLNGDVVFHPKVLQMIIKSKKDSVTAIKKASWDAEEVNVITNKKSEIIEIGKHISKELSSGEFVGVTKIGKEFGKRFINALDYFKSKNENRRFAADAINLAIQNWGGKIHEIDMTKWPVVEIDTIKDYNEAKKFWNSIKNDFEDINTN
ncbi:phosphocholine cytidylyltransferase family protein [Candidatus Nomurabacteria bacterium]|nr:phosphocholine cytidylyltransferase family protein [Candidatus Nomurabacteria bacterium]